MFAPLVAKPKALQPQHPTVVGQRPSQLLQRSIGNQAMLRLLAQRATATRSEPGTHEKENDAARVAYTTQATYWEASSDPTEPYYQGPPTAGPTPGPAPPVTPAPANCAAAFTGVSFTVAGAAGAARTPGAAATLGVDGSGNRLVSMNATGPVTYTPTVTIAAPSAAVAANYEAGLIQNVLTSDRRAIYSTGTVVTTAPSTAPRSRTAPPPRQALTTSTSPKTARAIPTFSAPSPGHIARFPWCCQTRRAGRHG